MGLLVGPRLRPGLPILDSAELQGMGLPSLDHRQQAATTTDSMTPPSSTACVVLRLLLPMTSCLQHSMALSAHSLSGVSVVLEHWSASMCAAVATLQGLSYYAF